MRFAFIIFHNLFVLPAENQSTHSTHTHCVGVFGEVITIFPQVSLGISEVFSLSSFMLLYWKLWTELEKRESTLQDLKILKCSCCCCNCCMFVDVYRQRGRYAKCFVCFCCAEFKNQISSPRKLLLQAFTFINLKRFSATKTLASNVIQLLQLAKLHTRLTDHSKHLNNFHSIKSMAFHFFPGATHASTFIENCMCGKFEIQVSGFSAEPPTFNWSAWNGGIFELAAATQLFRNNGHFGIHRACTKPHYLYVLRFTIRHN